MQTFRLIEWWPRTKNEETKKKTKAKHNILVGVERSRNKFLPDARLAFLDLAQQLSLRAADSFKPPSSWDNTG